MQIYLYKGLLHHILRVRPVSRKQNGRAIGLYMIPLINLIKSRAASCLQLSYQFHFVQGFLLLPHLRRRIRGISFSAFLLPFSVHLLIRD